MTARGMLDVNYPTLFWKCDFYCSEPGCGRRIAREGDLSDMYYKDGSTPEPAINDLLVRGYFLVVCSEGHENDLQAPRDATIMGGNPEPGMCDGPAAIIRSLMGL